MASASAIMLQCPHQGAKNCQRFSQARLENTILPLQQQNILSFTFTSVGVSVPGSNVVVFRSTTACWFAQTLPGNTAHAITNARAVILMPPLLCSIRGQPRCPWCRFPGPENCTSGRARKPKAPPSDLRRGTPPGPESRCPLHGGCSCTSDAPMSVACWLMPFATTQMMAFDSSMDDGHPRFLKKTVGSCGRQPFLVLGLSCLFFS